MTRAGALLLTPGAGSGRDHPTLRAIEAAVAPLPVLRHDFPYRRAGRKAPDRAPVLVAGAAILAEVLAAFGLAEVEASEHDLLRGVALDAGAMG